MTKILITGSRDYPPTAHALEGLFREIDNWLADSWNLPEMIVGMSPKGGVDTYAYAYGMGCGYGIIPVPAEILPGEFQPRSWQYAARNRKMVDMKPDVVLAFFVKGAGNRGTQMTVEMAEDKSIRVDKFEYDPYKKEFRRM